MTEMTEDEIAQLAQRAATARESFERQVVSLRYRETPNADKPNPGEDEPMREL